MISSALYFLCFTVLLTNIDKEIRVMSLFGMAHILLENTLYWWFSSHIMSFDIILYLTLCWILDVALLFASACILTGLKKKLTLCLAVPVLFLEMIVMQFPYLIPGLDFVMNSAYQSVMEILIVCATFKDTTKTEVVKAIVVVGLILAARFLPLFIV